MGFVELPYVGEEEWLRQRRSVVAATDVDGTEWFDIPGFVGVYQITKCARIRSLDKVVNCAHGSTRVYPGRELRPNVRSDGYMSVNLTDASGKQRKWYLHRLVLVTFCGDPPEGYEGCHNNGNPSDNRLSNLRWGTSSDNSYDTILHGRNSNASRSKCIRGHILDGPNLTGWESVRGVRKCKSCHRANAYIISKGMPISMMQEVSDEKYEKIMGQSG